MSALDSFMGGGSKSFPFKTPGDQVTGEVLDVDERQQTDMKTNEYAFWPNGQPKMMFTVKLQTDLHESEEDDGVRHVNLKWKSLRAVQDAVRGAGAKNIAIGGMLSLKYTGDGEPAQRGAAPPKEWKAWYKKPDPAKAFMGQQEADPFAAPARPAPVQAREAVNHHGQPQSEAPPAWAQPQPQQPILAESDIPF